MNNEIADASFTLVIVMVLVTDFFVFTKYKTYKNLPSFIISLCLCLDLLVRLIELMIRLLNTKNTSKEPPVRE